MRPQKGRTAISTASASGVVMILLVSFAVVGYFSVAPGGQISALQNQVSSLQSQNTSLQQQLQSLQGRVNSQNLSFQDRINTLEKELVTLNSSLGNYVVNQAPIVRAVTLTWTKDLSTQDRFFGGPIVVNQGDTVRVTFVTNDSAGHTFTLGPPYDFQINASVKGMFNDFTGKNFTGPPTNNSPGVVVQGSAGSATGTGSFVAKFVGIYSYVCIYHVNVGMFGFLIVLPNLAYVAASCSTTSTRVIPQSPKLSQASILKGAGIDPSSPGYSPATITVVVGVNNTVVWRNDDTIFHTVTSTDGSFNSGTIFAGQTWSHTFTQAGTFTYYFCQYHPWMKGKVIVKQG